jgi:uncharacterized protein YjiS (DUF1127 family)
MFLAAIIRKINEWTRFRRNLAELAALSDRELSDVGIHRADIRRIAREAAQTA